MGKKLGRAWLLILCGIIFVSRGNALAKEPVQPAFKITGYIEKIETNQIRIFVPRMKQSLLLLLSQNLRIINFADVGSKRTYSLKDLKEKDTAICEGMITSAGFLCESISFVRNSDNH